MIDDEIEENIRVRLPVIERSPEEEGKKQIRGKDAEIIVGREDTVRSIIDKVLAATKAIGLVPPNDKETLKLSVVKKEWLDKRLCEDRRMNL